MSLKRNIWLAYINGIELQYMLNICWIILFEQVIAIWLVGFNLTFDVHKKAWTFSLLNPHYTVIMALAFRIVVNKKKAVTYCQQALFIVKVFIKCSLHCLLNIIMLSLCHNLRLHMLKTCGIGKTVLSVSCARFKSHICKWRPPPPKFTAVAIEVFLECCINSFANMNQFIW